MLNMDLASMLQGLEKADFTSQELVEVEWSLEEIPTPICLALTGS
jgi:hypothetical protein